MERLDQPRQILAVSLAGLAGFVDAAGFLSAHGYFVSFMSGNTTRLGVNLALDWRHALIPALLIAGFVVGVAGGSIAGLSAGKRRKPAVLALVATLLALAALARELGQADLALGGMVLAMGALNNTLQRNGEVAVGVTYMTGTLVRLGQGIAARLTGASRGNWLVYLVLWTGLAGGAVLGAWVEVRSGALTLWLAAGFAALLIAPALRLAQAGEV